MCIYMVVLWESMKLNSHLSLNLLTYTNFYKFLKCIGGRMYIIANPQLWTSHDNKLGLDEEKCKAFNFILDVYVECTATRCKSS